MSGLAPGWRIEHDEDGLLLASESGALRIDDEVAEVIVSNWQTAGVSWMFSAATRAVLGRLGAVGDPAWPEPVRPQTPRHGPLVSVVIATHDARAMLQECLDSITRQTYGPIEIVVVDGGSGDGTREMVAGYPRAVVVDAPGNPGFAPAYNLGLRAATGRYLLCLNNDTELEPDAIGQLVRVATARPRHLAAVCAMTRDWRLRPVVESLGNVVGSYGFGSGRYAGFVDFGQFARDPELFSAAFTAAMIVREAWEAIGPLDTRYGYYYEDVDWSIRARLSSLKILPAPHAIVYHRGSASMGRRPAADKLRYVTRNRTIWALKSLRRRNVIGFGRRYAREDWQTLREALATGQDDEATAVVRAWLDIALRAPAAWRAREPLRRGRIVPDEVLFRSSGTAHPLMAGPYPRLDALAIRGHYLHVAPIARWAERHRRPLNRPPSTTTTTA
jgi:GT2 family glycosyltransferase